ncbi:hypothetical protein FRC03_008506 [Tulasnella sp. 419]|nr:hypothetical protein FRC03_008506 [Tulasnella sp. 419]
MASHNVKLTVVSDLICPWCYIGQRELQNAIEETKKTHQEITFDLEYRPFLLDPTLSCDHAIDKTAHYERKFGPERMKSARQMLVQRGKDLGINFQFGGMIRQTTAAHRLLLLAHQKGGTKLQQTLLTILFRAYFEEEKDIGDPILLSAIAEKTGLMTKEETLSFLSSDALKREILLSIKEAQKNGITGVPFTVINSKYAVSGAQKAEVFEEVCHYVCNHDLS